MSFKEKQFFYLYWADVFYIVGSVLYCTYSWVDTLFIVRFAELIQSYINIVGSLMFVGDCYLYVQSLIQEHRQQFEFFSHAREGEGSVQLVCMN